MDRLGGAFHVGLRTLLAAGNNRIFPVNTPLCAASIHIFGLRRMDGVLTAGNDNTLLGRHTVSRNTLRRCNHSLRY